MAKSRKVEESVGNYTARQPVKPAATREGAVRYAKSDEVAKVADRIFAERKELLRKLAQ
jgi:hypothetical protein